MKQFNILSLLQMVKQRKKVYMLVMSIVFVATVVVSLQTPNYYTSSVVLAPEYSSASGISSGLGNLASLAGVNISGLGGEGEDAINPGIYMEVVQSTTFLQGLFPVKVETADGKEKMTFRDYLLKDADPDDEDDKTYGRTGDNIISKSDDDLMRELSSAIVVKIDNTTDLITIAVTLEDPYIATCIVDTVSRHLQSYIYTYRTKKAQQDLEYAEKLYKGAVEEYNEASENYAKYSDCHRNSLLAAVNAETERLESEMAAKSQLMQQNAMQVSIAKAKLMARVPAYTVVQPAVMPLRKAGPKRFMMVLLMEMLSFCGLTIFFLLREKIKGFENNSL